MGGGTFFKVVAYTPYEGPIYTILDKITPLWMNHLKFK